MYVILRLFLIVLAKLEVYATLGKPALLGTYTPEKFLGKLMDLG